MSSNQQEIFHQLQRLEELTKVLTKRMETRVYPNEETLTALAEKLDEQRVALEAMWRKGMLEQLAHNSEFTDRLKESAQRIIDALNIFQIELGLRQEQMTSDILKHNVFFGLPRAKTAPFSANCEAAPRSRCTHGTREGLIQRIMDWATSDDPQSPPFFWLNGWAGMGKTTIAFTICELLKAKGLLGGSYFCSRQLDSHKSTLLIPTIVRHLASSSRSFADMLVLKLLENPELVDASLANQVQELLAQPWKMSSQKRVGHPPLLVVIDALDECDNGMHVLKLLLDAAEANLLPGLRFLVTSRPEPQLSSQLTNTGSGVSKLRVHLHDEPMDVVQRDIELFLRDSLPPAIVNDTQVKLLAQQSDGLFIYAATLVEFIKPQKDELSAHESKERLAALFQFTPSEDWTEGLSPTLGIDALYRQILALAISGKRLTSKEYQRRIKILHIIICLTRPATAEVVARLGETSTEIVEHVVASLYAVMFVSEDSNIFIFHASFPDFMLSSQRSNDFACIAPTQHTLLSRTCLLIMKEELIFNMCALESSFVPDEEVPDFEERVSKAINPTLSYACSSWNLHLSQASEQKDLLDREVRELVEEKVWFWMEAMSLLDALRQCREALDEVAAILRNYAALEDLVHPFTDFQEVVSRFISMPGSRITPHLYVSLLALWEDHPHVLRFRRHFSDLSKTTRRPVEKVDSDNRSILALDSPVFAVAFSPDDSRIISGSNDGTVCVWDSQTGVQILPPLKGHRGPIWSVAFSPDGSSIASASDDGTVRLWDAMTGTLVLSPMEGHTARVRSVAFTPDGRRIVSGSDDCTIRVWDAQSGIQILPPLEGHTGIVISVACSPDSSRIVSGSDDLTLRVWDVRNGTLCLPPLMGHTNWIWSVSFSPDGSQVISGSDDKTIRVWDAQTGAPVLSPMKGHTCAIGTIACSPDGSRIVSGSDDATVRVWDASSGDQVLPPLEGHCHWVACVAFSTDSTRIVSGSRDRTVRVWDTQTGVQLLPVLEEPTPPPGTSDVVSSFDTTSDLPLSSIYLEGHVSGVSSVAFSSDGSLFLSGSDDNTVRVWNARSGSLALPPLKGHGHWIRSVSFAPDDSYIVSGFDNGGICVWDSKSGKQHLPLLKGHVGGVGSVAFSPDCSLIVSGSDDGTICIWNAIDGSSALSPLLGHEGSVKSVKFSLDGSRIISGSDDGTVRIWDVKTGELVFPPLEGHTNWIWSVALSPDGSRIVSGSSDRSIRVWDALHGTPALPPLLGHGNTVNSVAFSPDGAYIISASNDKTLRLWDAQTGAELSRPLEGHTDWIWSVRVSPDGTQILSGSTDSTIRLWDAPSWMQLPIQSMERSLDAPSLPSPDLDPLDASVVLNNWSAEADGWVVHTLRSGEKLRLLWLPPNLHTVMTPLCTMIVSRQGCTEIDFGAFLFGRQWARSYVG
ncbi:WD40-repeat-containing domain protein [Flagelloscypha sp. PMI_526]|nr:WD40-repeat-containing domain protein [Flagelloscypha sp. PMI_526]